MEKEKNKPEPSEGADYAKMVAEIENLVVGIVHPPKLLDWFVGLAAITWGVSLLLSSRTSEYVLVGRYANWLMPVMIGAISSGAGLLIAEARSDKISSNWKRIFLLILAVVFAGMGLILFRVGDIDGVLIYSLMSLVILVLWLAEPGSRLLYMLLVQGLFAGLLISMRYFPGDIDIAYLTSVLTGGSDWVLLVWLFNLLIYIALSWYGYYRKRILLSIMIGLTALPLTLIALAYGSQGEWSKAFLFLMVAIFGVLVPFWEQIKFKYRKHRRIVYQMFGVILAFFVGTAFLIWIVQSILVENAKEKIADQVTYGRVLSEAALDSSVSVVEGLAQNAILVRAMEANRRDDVLSVIQGVFGGNRNLRQIVVVDRNGRVLTVYPFSVDLTGRSVANLDYFRTAINNGRTVVAEEYRPADNLDSGYALPISSPIRGSNRKSIGVMVGFFDLQLLSDRLAQVATPNSGQYFAALDQGGNWTINPDRGKINMPAVAGDPAKLGLTGRTGVAEGFDSSGVLSITAFTQIARTKWGLVLNQPMYTALGVSQTAYIAILAVASISVVIIGLTVLPRKSKEELNEAK